jgi:cytochrome c biogenesis protein CcmG/thiol:disulfide interchange protein DsbE
VSVIRAAGYLISRHKLAAGIVAAVIAAVAAVSVSASAGTGSSTAAHHADPMAPGFTVPVLADPARHISLNAQYKDKPVIVNFWASWCGPCQRETPLLAQWHKQHPAVSLIGLDENDSSSDALKFARSKGVTYTLASDPGVTVAQAYGVAGPGIPETFFLDARHRIVDHVYGALTAADLAKGSRLMNAS